MASSKKPTRKPSKSAEAPLAIRPSTAEDSAPSSDQGRVLVAGIGASAGGLEAFSQFLRALPANPGLAIVFVQHLAPHHKSALVSLLSSVTHLPVLQPLENVRLKSDHVYVIPPNRGLAIEDGTLVIHPRPTDRTQYSPIDTFFQSLAQAQGPDAIGVILSGTGSDGVEGVHAIKAAGGIVLVQDPATTKQDGMPRAAIAAGQIDLVLGPDALAGELARLAHNRPPEEEPRPRRAAPPLEPRQLEKVFALLRTSSGVDFSQYKLPTLQRRIQRRMALHKVQSLPQYIKLLEENPGEVGHLYQDILIHVTRFFREAESFAALSKEVFPAILDARQEDAPVRVWVPACSTGEEPYSVAMTLLECLGERGQNVPVQIFATDISETAIEQARAGFYPAAAVEELSPQRLQRFFTKADGQYRISKAIRDQCVFARQDLTRDPPFSRLDLVVCRNVLIYLGQAIQYRLIGVFHYALKAAGYLMLGSAETIGQHDDLFAVVDKKNRIFRKKLADLPADVQFTVPFVRPHGGRSPRSADDLHGGPTVVAEANRLILDRYSPPGVIVTEDMRIVHFRGQTGRFLEPASGDASLNLLKMCREGLLHGLRTALQTAKKKDAPVRREGLRVKTNGDFVNAAVEVVPLATAGEARHYLILFQTVAAPAPALRIAPRDRKRTQSGHSDEEVERLQRELVASREYLQSIIQDHEAANEELQSANEEILSSNEELQSTNEELDTATEELQSANEELNTVNDELHGRNEELARINSDLLNLLHGVQIAIVIVAGDLRIRRFTPAAERILNLIPGDIGRSIGHIKPNINCPDLERLILAVIDTVTVQQREVQDVQGRMYSLMVRPYKNVDNRIDGAVLALFDIDELRRHEQDAQQARELAEAVLNSVRTPLVVLDRELRVHSANAAFRSLFALDESDSKGRPLLELGRGDWNVAKLRKLLTKLLAEGSPFEEFEVRHEPPDSGVKRFRLGGRQISHGEHPASLALVEMHQVAE